MSKLVLDELTDRVAFLDPAGGKQRVRRVSARSAIIVLSRDWLSRLFVLHAWAARCTTDAMVEKILDVCQQYRPRIFGIEANAMQSLFVDTVRREARMKGLRLPLTPVNQPTKIEKEFRIRTALQPIIAEGRLFIQADQHELRNELQSFPLGMTRDLVDALASAVSLYPQRPTTAAREEETESYLSYLRNSGAPASYIEQIARSVGR